MKQSIKLTMDQMRKISLFQNITKVTPRDCIDDEKQDRLIFVVNEGKMGLAIGKNGSNIKSGTTGNYLGTYLGENETIQFSISEKETELKAYNLSGIVLSDFKLSQGNNWYIN